MQSRVVTVAVVAICVLSCAVADDEERVRTTRRELDLDEEENSFVKNVESFLGDSEGRVSEAYWPEGADPSSHFGVVQNVTVSDLLLQLCIMSGSYTRPKPPPLPSQNPSPPSTTSGTPTKKSEKKYNRIFQELYNLLKARTVDNSVPPIENWQEDPYDILEEADHLFTNLCFTLFELRRLNRKLVRRVSTTTTPTPTTQMCP